MNGSRTQQPKKRASTRNLKPRKPDGYCNWIHGFDDDTSDRPLRENTAQERIGPAEFLRRLLKPDEIVYIFVVGRKNLVGYYDYEHLDNLANDVRLHSGRAAGIYYSLNVISRDLHSQARNRLVSAHKGEAETGKSPRNTDVLRRRLLLIDFDPKRPESSQSANEAEKKAGLEKSQVVRQWLQEQGWPHPVIVDSGNGIHLLYRIELEADDDGLIKRVLHAIAAKFSDDFVEIDTKVCDARRIAKLPGTMACKGENTKVRPHRVSKLLDWPSNLEIVSNELLQKLAGDRPIQSSSIAPSASAKSIAATGSLKVLCDRAQKYVNRILPAVQGQGGDANTFNVAMKLVDDFALPRDQAKAILKSFGDRCLPPWSETELDHKLDRAFELTESRGGPTGCLARDILEVAEDNIAEMPGADLEPLPGPLAPMDIPDFHLFDASLIRMSIPEWRKKKLRDILFITSVWQQQRRDAVVNDLLARAVRWGANYPRNWLRQLRVFFKRTPNPKCPQHCPLYDSEVKHRHFKVGVRDKNGEIIQRGILEEFSLMKLFENQQFYSFNNDDRMSFYAKFRGNLPDFREKLEATKRTARKSGHLRTVYLPAFVFGLSPAVGLTHSQARLWMGIHGELTRASRFLPLKQKNGKVRYEKVSPSSRPDQAALIRNAQVVTSGTGNRRIHCPLLDADKIYVVAGGNLRSRQGKGYRIVHSEVNSWIHWAGYSSEQLQQDRWGCVHAFFDDLERLAPELGLTVVARHHQRREWKDLNDLQLLSKSPFGREWIEESHLRIFLPWDYPVRWRHWLSARLGFGWIPGGEPSPFPLRSADDRVDLTVKLKELMASRGWTRKNLADELGVSPSTVTMSLNGERKSKKFWDAVRQLIEC